MRKITERARLVYAGEKKMWPHAMRVAKLAKLFAGRIGANQFVAEAGGLLHDLGAAMYGRANHHIDGAEKASVILLECGCPLIFIGPVINTIYSHRKSGRVAFMTEELQCVALADALDHCVKANLSIEDFQREVFRKLKKPWSDINIGLAYLAKEMYAIARQKL